MAFRSRSRSTYLRPDPNAPIRMSGWVFYPLLLATLISAGYYIGRQDWIAAGGILTVMCCAGIGFRVGLARISASIVALTAAIYFAPALGMAWEQRFAAQFGTSGLTNRILCIAAVGVGISLIVTLLLGLVSRAFLARRRRLSALNCSLGFGFGLIEGAVIVLVVLGGLISLRPTTENDQRRAGRLNAAMDAMAAKTQTSVMGPLVEQHNPFERVEALAQIKQVQRSVQTLSQPKNVDQLLKHPQIVQLQKDPSFQRALDELRRDPEVQAFLQQERPIDRPMLMRLMSHPALLQLVDRQDFRERAKRVLLSVDQEPAPAM
ncbi:hypothetical protein FYK55_19350 [Roseiconus nitratireducens]|uniref:Colicin V production protein n=1 Tax=Roseiconus nitratireducens TaxID=2605748 RepID=A0A5M6D0T1_9BACT|nr:CvpA family protein [Roseiconus nitratireducens]KAA5541054.1 hypothetical protein FYK55_19350 [Roseiconus nitratireducens]